MRYRVTRWERMALDDLIAGKPYQWHRTLSGHQRRLYASAWLWFQPRSQDQAECQSLYADRARADLGLSDHRFCPIVFVKAWVIAGFIAWLIYRIIRMLALTLCVFVVQSSVF